MAWKPKQKPLTPEEALATACKEAAPFWLNSPPLLAGTRLENGQASVYPLDKQFNDKAWGLLFVDLTTFSADGMLKYAKEWLRRYSGFDLGFLIVVRSSYSFMDSAQSLQPFLKRIQLTCPIVLDRQGSLFEVFGAAKASLPKFILYSQRKALFGSEGVNWSATVEPEIQRFLRLKDPGLPLASPVQMSETAANDLGRLELNQTTAKASGVRFSGKWNLEANRVSTSDPAATLVFKSPASRVAVIAQTLAQWDEASRLRVELGGETVFDAAAGSDLIYGDDGGSELKLRVPLFYEALANLPLNAREVTFRFPDAARLPVAIYGLRFGA